MMSGWSSSDLNCERIEFSNAAGSLTTTAKGAIPAMPTRGEIEACMKIVRLKTK